MNIYVGNISYGVTEDELKAAFGEYGTVTSCKIITDKFTGNSKGFGFVEMETSEEGQEAINALNNYNMGDRPLKVNEARPREDRGPRDGGGGGGGGGGRGRY